MKKLSEMTLEELWELFPIFLTEHRKEWETYYLEMEAFLKNILADCSVVRISHIGSTGIDGIWAKPIVDVLVETEPADFEKAAALIAENGFILMSQQENRKSFNMGYTESGFAEKVYHLHLRCAGDNDELYFRDYIRTHPEDAEEYEALKLSLWKKYEHDRDAYTDSKTDFIRSRTEKAKKLYGDRYETIKQ